MKMKTGLQEGRLWLSQTVRRIDVPLVRRRRRRAENGGPQPWPHQCSCFMNVRCEADSSGRLCPSQIRNIKPQLLGVFLLFLDR